MFLFKKRPPKPRYIPSVQSLLDSFKDTPEKWAVYAEWTDKSRHKEVWALEKNKVVIYNGEGSFGFNYKWGEVSYTARGFCIMGPHHETFSDTEQYALKTGFNAMITNKNSLVMARANTLTYTELQEITKELVQANSAYCLTSPNKKLREYAEKIK